MQADPVASEASAGSSPLPAHLKALMPLVRLGTGGELLVVSTETVMMGAVTSKNRAAFVRSRQGNFDHVYFRAKIDEVKLVKMKAKSLNCIVDIQSSGGFSNEISIRLVDMPYLLETFEQLMPERLDIDDGVYDGINEYTNELDGDVRSVDYEYLSDEGVERSPPMGLAYLLAAILVLVVSFAGFLINFWFGLACTPLVGIAYIAFKRYQRLTLPSAEMKLARDPRRPIVFLRAFNSEHRTTPRQWMLTGSFLVGCSIISNTVTRLIWLVVILAALVWLAFWIIGQIRYLDPQRIEERIAKVAGRLGPVIAMGKPGERFASGGAARTYAPHAQWQDRVAEMIAASQAVLLQVDVTEGTQWEFRYCLANVDPRRVLIMLTSGLGVQQRYDEIYLSVSDDLRRVLPLSSVGAGFLMYDENWTPIPLFPAWRPSMIGFLVGSPVNYGKTLRPFMRRLKGLD